MESEKLTLSERYKIWRGKREIRQGKTLSPEDFNHVIEALKDQVKEQPKYPLGLPVTITQDCRPWWKRFLGRDLTGRSGVLTEYAVIEDSPEMTTLQIPVFRVGRHFIAGFECWWERVKK